MVFQSGKSGKMSRVLQLFSRFKKREKSSNSFLKWHKKQLYKQKEKENKRCCGCRKKYVEKKKCCGWFSKVVGKSSHCFSDRSTTSGGAAVFGTKFKISTFPSQALLRHKYLILSGDKNLLIFFWRGSNALKFELLKSFLFQMAFVFTIFII